MTTLSKAGRRLFRRRLALIIIGFVLVVYTAVSLHDEHVRHCMVEGQPDSRSEQRICNTIFPFHDHPMR